MKNISILGSTGSIGVNTLNVVLQNEMQFSIVGLAAGRNIDLLKAQIEQFRPMIAAVMDETHALRLKERLPCDCKTEILWGPAGYREVARVPEAEMVVSAMVGSAGLAPTLEAIDAGKHIALANKETLVAAGHLVVEKAREKKIQILPVDSEHSAIFQCLQGQREQDVRRIILTASGGPFRTFTSTQLEQVTPADALKHPNWDMGRKITVDSASMMNKGLEIIEAKWLFGLDIDRIDVLVHPQSIIHSMVEFVDGSVMAQLGIPDMRIPIAYAMSFPSRMPACGVFLDFLKATPLEFFQPDPERFPCLKLACDAGRAGGTLPVVLNGANEVAVEAFLKEEIKFTQIPVVIAEALSRHRSFSSPIIEEILEADGWSRREANKIIKEINH
ncbi:MAG: 1-deoxy-D-xylulose-5-phosphate reductoisomerase [Syntrophus sp. (in: bacteria)]|nr:1-deoxy-D-xylulose-5-phosphate reductoisomerase [Syntrophus sp. (in: bacteria)]